MDVLINKFCIVVPCFNEADRINLSEFRRLSLEGNTDLVFVNDGSSDETYELLSDFCETMSSCHLIHLNENVGKAEAVRRGFLFSVSKEYSFTGYADADLATPVNELIKMIKFCNNESYSVITGLRLKRLGAKVDRKKTRHYLGRIFATFASIVLKLEIYDTQCGAKLFRINEVFSRSIESRFWSNWLFDVELIGLIKSYKSKSIKVNYYFFEFPLYEWRDISGSKLKKIDFLKAPFELIGIWFKLNKIKHKTN